MATYWDIINRNDLTPEQKAQEIQAVGELERKQIDRENLGAKARIGLGATLQGVSALPVFNIPYVGTGLGGALFETGNAIMQGKTKEDIAKDAGTGFVVGETVGAIPYVGKVAAKTKAGQAAGNQASKLFNYLTDTKVGQKVAEIAPKVEDLLMTDIKAFNPNRQTVYHGSPYDFAKFSNEAIGTGEGAQAHGYGHYAAKNKDVAEGYRRNLSKKDTPYEEYKTLTNYIDFLNGLKEKAGLPEGLENALQKSKTELSNLMNTYKPEEYLNNVNNGQLYKLSIPKDDVMLREDLPLSQQPLKVQEGLRDYFNQNPLQKHERRFFEDIENPDLLETTMGGDLYRQIARNVLRPDKNMKQREANAIATQILQDKGIKGISYNGGIDGEARVVFNPDDIEIVRKYYNQPELFQKLTGQTPNTGAVASSLYEAMTR